MHLVFDLFSVIYTVLKRLFTPFVTYCTFIVWLFQRYLHHVKRHDQVMLELDDATKNYKDFEVAYKEFEVCWNYLVIV